MKKGENKNIRNKDFGELVIALREQYKKGMDRKKLCQKTELSENIIGDIERGERSKP